MRRGTEDGGSHYAGRAGIPLAGFWGQRGMCEDSHDIADADGATEVAKGFGRDTVLDEEVAQDGVGTAVSEVEQADLQWAGTGELDLASARKSSLDSPHRGPACGPIPSFLKSSREGPKTPGDTV